MGAMIGTAWATFWFILCVQAYDPLRHTANSMLLAWLIIALGPIALYKLLSL